VLQGPPGKTKSTRQLQVSSGLMFDALTRHDAEHVLLQQARSFVMEQQLGLSQLRDFLHKLDQQRFLCVDTARFSVFAFPLWAERLRESLSNELASDRIARMVERLNA
jgi:ATP-dependent helicase Lhr and Lhr-like helicase